MSILVGCGGGGGGSSTQDPIVTPTPLVSPSPVASPSPSPVVTPKERAIAANFSPNYIPANVPRYLRWANNKSLRIFVHPGVDNLVDKRPANNIDPARAEIAVREAIGSWTSASSTDFQFSLVSNPAEAEIEIYFVNELRLLDGSTVSGVGNARFSFIFPNANDEARGILESSDIQIVASQPAANLTDTISHEIGHALGIESHSEDANDLLFATSIPPTIITQRDQNTLFFLYYSPTVLGGRSASSTRKSAVYTDEILCKVR